MKHDKWIGSVLPYEGEESGELVEFHRLSQLHGDREAAIKYIVSLEAANDRKAQAFMLRWARRDLRALIAEHGHE